MRLLHVRYDHVGPGALAQNTAPFRAADRRGDGWEHLPVWNVFADRGRNFQGRKGRCSVKSQFDFEPGFEPERYELDAAPAYRFNLGRRTFFKSVGAGIVVALMVERALAQQESGRRRGGGGRAPQDIGAWLHIAEDGRVTAYTGKVEVGQNIRTSLAQVIAEELRVPVESVRMVMADTKLTPYDAGTFGSRTTPDMARRLRQVAADAREVLIDRAAEERKVDRATFSAENGSIVSKDGKKVAYGDLTKGQKLTHAIAENPPTTSPNEWKIAGKSVPKVDARAFVTGSTNI